jgi:hypothetical protein
MEFFSQLGSLDASKLPRYLQIIFTEIKPILERIDPDKISDTSKIVMVPQKKNFSLLIDIGTKEDDIEGINVIGKKSQFILSCGGAERIYNSKPDHNDQSFIELVKKTIEAYLQGITIIDSMNKKGRRIKRDYYFGIDTEKDESKKIGTWNDRYFSKVYSTNKVTYKFLK